MKLKAVHGKLRLIATPPAGKPFITTVSAHRIQSARARLARDLAEIRNEWGTGLEKPPWSNVDEALAMLRRRSRAMWSKVIEDPDEHGRFTSFVARELRQHQPRDGRPPLVEVSSSIDHLLPFELLLVGSQPLAPVLDEKAMLKACEQWLGFRAVIRRVLSDARTKEGIPQDRTLAAYPLPIALFVDAYEDSGRRMRQDLLALGDKVKLDGPWPKTEQPYQVPIEVGRRVYDPRRRFAGPAAEIPDQIQHFACHCFTEGEPDEWTLMLRGSSGEDAPVTLEDLETEIHEAAHNAADDGRQFARPLVFLNGCGSAEVAPFSAASFCRVFLKNGNRAFIGSEGTLPKAVAEEFSAYFYSELLSQTPVGAALLKAKRMLVLQHRNLLGCLYSLHGECDLRVPPPVLEARQPKTQSASP